MGMVPVLLSRCRPCRVIFRLGPRTRSGSNQQSPGQPLEGREIKINNIRVIVCLGFNVKPVKGNRIERGLVSCYLSWPGSREEGERHQMDILRADRPLVPCLPRHLLLLCSTRTPGSARSTGVAEAKLRVTR